MKYIVPFKLKSQKGIKSKMEIIKNFILALLLTLWLKSADAQSSPILPANTATQNKPLVNSSQDGTEAKSIKADIQKSKANLKEEKAKLLSDKAAGNKAAVASDKAVILADKSRIQSDKEKLRLHRDKHRHHLHRGNNERHNHHVAKK